MANGELYDPDARRAQREAANRRPNQEVLRKAAETRKRAATKQRTETSAAKRKRQSSKLQEERLLALKQGKPFYRWLAAGGWQAAAFDKLDLSVQQDLWQRFQSNEGVPRPEGYFVSYTGNRRRPKALVTVSRHWEVVVDSEVRAAERRAKRNAPPSEQLGPPTPEHLKGRKAPAQPVSGPSTPEQASNEQPGGDPAIKDLQRRLNAEGADLIVDGIYGPLTRAAEEARGVSPSYPVETQPAPSTNGAAPQETAAPQATTTLQALNAYYKEFGRWPATREELDQYAKGK